MSSLPVPSSLELAAHLALGLFRLRLRPVLRLGHHRAHLRRAVLLLLCAGAAVAVQRRKELLVKPAPAKASSESA